MPRGRYTNKYDMWGDTIRSGIEFRRNANFIEGQRDEDRQEREGARAEDTRRWEASNARAEEQMQMSREQQKAIMEDREFNNELKRETQEIYKARQQFLASGGDPSIAANLLSKPIGQPVQITNQGGKYMMKVGDGPEHVFAANQDEFMAKTMQIFGDDAYMNAIFTKRINEKAEKAQMINPGHLVNQGGKAGVLTRDPNGAISFNEVPGGVDMPQDPEKAAAATKAMTDQQKKDLETALMPFASKGTQMLDPNTFEITTAAQNALDGALALINKHQEGGTLSTQEQQKLRHAYRAWKLYDQVSGSIAERNFQQPGAGQAAPEGQGGFEWRIHHKRAMGAN